MEPLSIVFGSISLIVSALTAWLALSRFSEERFSSKVESLVSLHTGAQEMKIQALEIKLGHLSESTVRREDISELKSDIKNLVTRVEDLKDLLVKIARNEKGE